jgi:hypothetical protein
METLWSPAGATGVNQWQIALPRKLHKQAKARCDQCDRLRRGPIVTRSAARAATRADETGELRASEFTGEYELDRRHRGRVGCSRTTYGTREFTGEFDVKGLQSAISEAACSSGF